MSQQKLLLVYPHYSSFVKTDAEILSSRYQVIPYHFRPARGALAVATALIRQFIFLALHIRKFNLVYIWFADQHSLLPVLFARMTGRRSYLVIGGYDVCRIKALHYGVFCSKPRGWAAITSMKRSTLNLAVSLHVARKVRAITRQDNLLTVYNCVNLPGNLSGATPPEHSETEDTRAGEGTMQEPSGNSAPEPSGRIPQQASGRTSHEASTTARRERKMVLTVARIDSERTFRLKGVDTFMEVARLMPEVPFCIAGFGEPIPEWLNIPVPSNLTLTGEIRHENLPGYYLHAAVYCQFSLSESFGVALAEAIHYGCVPLVTREGGMPEIVANPAYTVGRDPQRIAVTLRNILNHPLPEMKLQEKFLLPRRREIVLSLLNR